MPLSRDLVTRFLGDDANYQATIRRVAGGTDKLNDRMDRFAKGARTAFVAGGVVAAAHFGRQLFDLGIQVDAMDRRFDEVFGDAGGGIAAEIERLAEGLGIAAVRARGMAADVGQLLINMGLTQTEAAESALSVIQLTDAWDQFTGGQVGSAEISDKIVRGLAGQTRGLVELGIKFTEADVRARLAAAGQDHLTGSARAAAESQIRLQLVMEQSAGVLEDYAAKETDAERAQDKAAASLDELKVSIGQAVAGLAPLVGGVGELVGFLNQIPGASGGLLTVLGALKFGAGPVGALAALTAYGVVTSDISDKIDVLRARQREVNLELRAAGRETTIVGQATEATADVVDILTRAQSEAAGGARQLAAAQLDAGIQQDFLNRVNSEASAANRTLAADYAHLATELGVAGSRSQQGALALQTFAQSLASIDIETPRERIAGLADDFVSIWGEVPERVEEIDVGQAIADALAMAEQRAAFTADLEKLVDEGFGALVDELENNPNRAEAIALADHFAGDLAAAADFADQLGVPIDRSLVALKNRLRDSAIWAEMNAIFRAQGNAAFEAYASGIDQAAAGGAGQRIVDSLQRSILRGGARGIS